LKQRAYSVSKAEADLIKKEVDEMLKQGIIRYSNSPWASPVVIVPKKDGTRRFCVDYRRINKITEKDSYPIPRINDLLDNLGGMKWFTSIDLASGYWQVMMDKDDRKKTAFVCREGLYEFNIMPFGLTNAPATFQRLMDNVLFGIRWKFTMVYLDDIIIFSKSWEEHIRHINIVIQRLRKAGLKMKFKKCKFATNELEYLGYIVTRQGLKADPKKIEKIIKWPTPTNTRELRGFIGLASYYRRFVKRFSVIANPLNHLLKKETGKRWTGKQRMAFIILKRKLTEAPILIFPDFSKEFFLYTDASQLGLGATLEQKEENGNEGVIEYASRGLSKSEKNYEKNFGITELECLAVYWATKHFRKYLDGQHFYVITDHSALDGLYKRSQPQGRTGRWILNLQAYTFDIIHRPGRVHSNVDGLSRLPKQY
jgi:hypothetical protein